MHILRMKALAVGIVLLLLGTCIIPATAQDTKKHQSVSKDNAGQQTFTSRL